MLFADSGAFVKTISVLQVLLRHIKIIIAMNTPENNPAADNDQQTNDDGLDLTTPNDNQELDRINDAVQAAEPSFTLNLDTEKSIQKEAGEDLNEDDINIKQ